MTELQQFIFIRHGETDWNREGLFQGRSDIPLNETGREQAHAAARIMANVTVSKVMVSPLRRAIETAELAFPDRLDLIKIEDELIECDFGSLDGRSIKATMQEFGITRKEQLAEILPEDGESWEALLGRCQLILDKVATHQTTGSHTVLIGHDAVLQGLSEALTGGWFDSKHGQPYYFKNKRDGWQIDEIGGWYNFTHLSQSM